MKTSPGEAQNQWKGQDSGIKQKKEKDWEQRWEMKRQFAQRLESAEVFEVYVLR